MSHSPFNSTRGHRDRRVAATVLSKPAIIPASTARPTAEPGPHRPTTTHTHAHAHAEPNPRPAPDPAPGIEFEAVNVYAGDNHILKEFTLSAPRGSVVALLGPSGAGKTTALRAVAGLAPTSSGRIALNNVDVTHVPTQHRGLGMVVQQYALFPHLSVADNVAFGMAGRNRFARAKAARRERVRACLEMVGMTDFSRRYPGQLSGGQQQRVAIARALAPEPEVLLLDEPLSALDAQLRGEMLAQLSLVHRQLPELTMLYVTHGQSEALTLADHIAVMANGELVEYGPTQELYRTPKCPFTASFLGGANVLDARVIEPRSLHVGPEIITLATSHSYPHGRRVQMVLRPHKLRVLSPANRGARPFDNTADLLVTDVQWRGSTHIISGQALGHQVTLESLELAQAPNPGDTLRIGFYAEDVLVLPTDSHPVAS